MLAALSRVLGRYNRGQPIHSTIARVCRNSGSERNQVSSEAREARTHLGAMRLWTCRHGHLESIPPLLACLLRKNSQEGHTSVVTVFEMLAYVNDASDSDSKTIENLAGKGLTNLYRHALKFECTGRQAVG